MSEPRFVPLAFERKGSEEMLAAARALREELETRRSVRDFSNDPIPEGVIEECLHAAGSAPSGANLQPWTFVVVRDPEVKRRIREAAETEERRFYEERIPEAWAEVLGPLGTDNVKEHITDAPWIVMLFRHSQRERPSGEMAPTYYAQESCGIAAGIFIAAIHQIGLCTLTHTPSPMGFLRDILGRPDHEHAMLLMPVGYPAENARVPDLKRKGLDEVSEFFE